jgi:transposase
MMPRVKEEESRTDEKKKLLELRKKAAELYFEGGLKKKAVARKLGMSIKFVRRWTAAKEMKRELDGRGWRKGHRRQLQEDVELRIRGIHDYLSANEMEFYCGATAIEQEWRKRYSSESAPSLRSIGYLLRDLGLSGSRKRHRNKGAARYLCYPEHTIYERIGCRVLESDFIGRKYFVGQSKPLNFIGFAFKKSPRLRYFLRVPGEDCNSLTGACELFFHRFERPDVIKIDNGPAGIGGGSPRNLSRAMLFFLKERIVPVFAVPRKPFTQASIEGNNSVFSKKFWNTRFFKTLDELDIQLGWFNEASQRYLRYSKPDATPMNTSFLPKVIFIRQVKEDLTFESTGFIEVLNEKIRLPQEFINYYVLAEWNLVEERLIVNFERDLSSETIHEQIFRINTSNKKESIKARRELNEIIKTI